ncbi:MAG: hypothetical protein ACI97A_001290 [Planctomycetota bacterium]|jgi:hypothetical protein
MTLGKISSHLVVEDHVLRKIVDQDDEDDPSVEIFAQGHIRNCTKKTVDAVTIDVSYYAQDGAFLGLDKTGFLDDDEIEAGCAIPFSIELDIPDGADSLVLNVSAKKMATGFLFRWLVGGKG